MTHPKEGEEIPSSVRSALMLDPRESGERSGNPGELGDAAQSSGPGASGLPSVGSRETRGTKPLQPPIAPAREIRFRVWDGEEMIMPNDGQHVVFYNDPQHIEWGLYSKGGIKLCDSQYGVAKVMQFTGLHDKNGKEIYEGDVLVKIALDYDSELVRAWSDGGYEGEEPAHTEVKRDVATLEHFRYWLQNESFGYEGEELEEPGEWKVIGNIYENPELLRVSDGEGATKERSPSEATEAQRTPEQRDGEERTGTPKNPSNHAPLGGNTPA